MRIQNPYKGTTKSEIVVYTVASIIMGLFALSYVLSFYSQSIAWSYGNAIPEPVLRWIDGQWMYVYGGSQNTATYSLKRV